MSGADPDSGDGFVKNILYVIICLFFMIGLDLQSRDAEHPVLEGKSFIGKPVKGESVSGCEGCGEPGYIKFEKGGRFELAWPGSDEIDSGTYSRKGQKIYIRIGDGKKVYLFLLSKNEIELVCKEMNFTLRDTKYPWKK